jgi:hypothetical protein
MIDVLYNAASILIRTVQSEALPINVLAGL